VTGTKTWKRRDSAWLSLFTKGEPQDATTIVDAGEGIIDFCTDGNLDKIAGRQQ
jgi:hypothetical protein